MNKININNTRGGFIVDYKLLIIFILALILCYFGLFAEGLRYILSWEVGFIDSAFLFMESLIILYFILLIYFFYYNNKFVLKRKNLNNFKYIKYIKKIKRFYRSSLVNYVKFKEIINLGGNLVELSDVLYNTIYNVMTKKNVSLELKNQKNMTDKQSNNSYYTSKIEKVAYSHKGLVEGVTFNQETNEIILSDFTPIITKSAHSINIVNNDFQNLLNFNFKPYIPTVFTNEVITLNNVKFDIKYTSLVKNIIKENKSIILNEESISKLPNDFLKLLQEKNKKIMELIKLKDYEFFNLIGDLYMLHNNYILKQGNIILYADYSKKVPVTFDIYKNICKEITLNPLLNSYFNLDDKNIKLFSDNYDFFIQHLKKN